MNKKVILIDGQNNMYRAYYKYANMKSRKGKPSSIVYGLPLIVGGLLKKFKPDEILIIFDHDRNKKRQEIWPDYKKREKGIRFDADDFHSQKETVHKLFKALGVPIVHQKGQEADDFIYKAIREYKARGFNEIIIASRDKDFRQLVDNKVSLWVVQDDHRVTKDNIEKVYGYTPRETLDDLILQGDKSDVIPGMPGFGEKTARAFIKEYGSIRKYLKGGHQFRKVDNELLKEVYKRNKALIGIKYFCRKYLKNVPMEITKGNSKIDYQYISEVCNDYDIKTFADPKFTKTFKDLLNR